jgi:2-dehydropantoate 2-reductase
VSEARGSYPSPRPFLSEETALIAVFGTGAVGLGIGSCLLAADEPVRFATRNENGAQALLTSGVERTGLFGSVHSPPHALDAGVGADSLRGCELDWILVCSKTPASSEIADALRAVWNEIRGARRVVVCHNGWGSAARFAAQLPKRQIYSARVYTGFQRRGPNRVEITVHAEPIRIGSLYGADLAPLRALCAAITRGGVPCETSDDIEGELWSKMLYNCSLNPLGALIGVAYGELAQYPETRSILEAVIAEIFALLDATGRRTRWRDAHEYLEIFWNELLPPTAAHESSMLQDLRAGRRTEVEALNGAVVELAREHGLEVPVNRALLELIRAREQQRSRPH